MCRLLHGSLLRAADYIATPGSTSSGHQHFLFLSLLLPLLLLLLLPRPEKKTCTYPRPHGTRPPTRSSRLFDFRTANFTRARDGLGRGELVSKHPASVTGRIGRAGSDRGT
jgi:hypothetical protein